MEIERKKRRKEKKKLEQEKSKWIDFKLFSFYGLTNYSTYSNCGGKSHHGQGHGVFNIKNSVMSNKETRTIFFSIAKQSTKSFALTFSLAFMLMYARVN